MNRVTGIVETALYVADLHRSAEFYRRLFGFGTLSESERLIALNVADRDVLLLFKQGTTLEPLTTEGGVIPGHGSSGQSHLAFSITAADMPAWEQALKVAEVPLESTVTWSGNAQSLYFRDPDGHLLELVTPGVWAIY